MRIFPTEGRLGSASLTARMKEGAKLTTFRFYSELQWFSLFLHLHFHLHCKLRIFIVIQEMAWQSEINVSTRSSDLDTKLLFAQNTYYAFSL